MLYRTKPIQEPEKGSVITCFVTISLLDACTNIPNPDDTGSHLMLHDKGLFEGREDTFNCILRKRGLGWKCEEFLGWHHVSIYKPSYRVPGWKPNMVKT